MQELIVSAGPARTRPTPSRSVARAGLVLLFVAAIACSPGGGNGGAEEPTPVAEARAARAVGNGEITCGPFVDGIADGGRDFERGRCSGETCTDLCGCVCLECSDDSGFCYGLCAETEGCDPLSLPPGEWEVELGERVLVSADG